MQKQVKINKMSEFSQKNTSKKIDMSDINSTSQQYENKSNLDWLIHRFQDFHNRSALIWNNENLSYGDFLDRALNWQSTLRRMKIPSGVCVSIQGDYSPNSCALLMALMLNGNIAVPISASIGTARRKEWFDIAEVSCFFSFDHSDNWQFSREERQVSHPFLRQLQLEKEPGLVLFSSGSTGKSKATLLSFSRLIDRLKLLRKGYRTLAFLLLDHIGGINTLLYTLSQGGTAITVGDRTPKSICSSIDSFQIQLLPTTPTFLNMLLISEAYKNYDLSSLELISYGTEPMPISTLHHLRQIFPQIKLKQTYGLSELGILPVSSKTSDSVWMRIKQEGVEYKIIDNILWVRAETAMIGYLNAPSPFNAEGWLNTGDIVEVEGDYLRILGRKSEIINVGGEKVYPVEVENVILQMDNIKDVVVIGKPNPLVGQVVIAKVILFHPENLKELRKRIRTFCKQYLEPFKLPAEVQISNQPHHSERFKRMRR